MRYVDVEMPRRLALIAFVGCSAPPRPAPPPEAPIVVRPLSECPEAVAAAEPPKVSASAAAAESAPPKPVAPAMAPSVDPSSPLALAVSRIPPQKWRVKMVEVQALPSVGGQLRVQGRGSVALSTYNPMYANVADAQLEIALPNADAACQGVLARARDAKTPVQLEGVGTTQATNVQLLGRFALVEFKSLTMCMP